MTTPRILVAGIGNIFLGDDAFGVEVVRELSRRPISAEVRIVDFGIRGLDLAYALLECYEVVILVDAMPRGGAHGQVYVVEPDRDAGSPLDPSGGPLIETHNLNPAKVLQLVEALGGRVSRLLVVGCEPVPLEDHDDIQPGLSATACAAIPVAVELIVGLIGELIEAGEPRGMSVEAIGGKTA